jgi:hypothetical protein
VLVVAPSAFTLTVSSAAGGAILSTPGGISCGSICSVTFPANTVVILSAAPDGSHTFGAWGGACSGSLASCVLTMNSSKSVSASWTTLASPSPSRPPIDADYVYVSGTITNTIPGQPFMPAIVTADALCECAPSSTATVNADGSYVMAVYGRSTVFDVYFQVAGVGESYPLATGMALGGTPAVTLNGSYGLISISGRVEDISSVGLNAIFVYGHTTSTGSCTGTSYQGYTSETGDYTLLGPPGTKVCVEKDYWPTINNWWSGNVATPATGYAAALAITGPATNVNFRLAVNHISGTVRNAGGSPLPNVVVYAFAPVCGSFLDARVTRADGTYTLSFPEAAAVVAAQTTAVSFHSSTGQVSSCASATAVTGGSGPGPTIDLVMPGYRVTGTIRDDAGGAISGVYVLMCGAICQVATTDATGGYALTASGSATPAIFGPDNVHWAPYGYDTPPPPVNITSDMTAVNFTLARLWHVHGVATSAATGLPLARVTATVKVGGSGATCCTYVSEGRSDGFGVYDLYLANGQYRLVYESVGYHEFWWNGAPAGAVAFDAATDVTIANAALSASYDAALTTFAPPIILSPTSGTPGSTVGVTGSGFPPGETVRIRVDGATQSITPNPATVANDGTFSLTFPFAPYAAAGPRTVTAQAGLALGTATFTATQGITTNIDRGTAGAIVYVTGALLPPNWAVTLKWDSTTLAIPNLCDGPCPAPVTDSSGHFDSTGIQIPAGAGGPHTLSAIAGGVTVSTTITQLNGLVGTGAVWGNFPFDQTIAGGNCSSCNFQINTTIGVGMKRTGATLSLSVPAPSGGLTFAIASSSGAATLSTSTVTFAAGQTVSSTFDITGVSTSSTNRLIASTSTPYWGALDVSLQVALPVLRLWNNYPLSQGVYSDSDPFAFSPPKNTTVPNGAWTSGIIASLTSPGCLYLCDVVATDSPYTVTNRIGAAGTETGTVLAGAFTIGASGSVTVPNSTTPYTITYQITIAGNTLTRHATVTPF